MKKRNYAGEEARVMELVNKSALLEVQKDAVEEALRLGGTPKWVVVRHNNAGALSVLATSLYRAEALRLMAEDVAPCAGRVGLEVPESLLFSQGYTCENDAGKIQLGRLSARLDMKEVGETTFWSVSRLPALA